jgi:hypothetical protein
VPDRDHDRSFSLDHRSFSYPLNNVFIKDCMLKKIFLNFSNNFLSNSDTKLHSRLEALVETSPRNDRWDKSFNRPKMTYTRK